MLWQQCQGAPPISRMWENFACDCGQVVRAAKSSAFTTLGVAKRRCHELGVVHRSKSHEQWPSFHCNTCCLFSIILNLCLSTEFFKVKCASSEMHKSHAYDSMSLDKCMHPCNPHTYQDIEPFHQPQKYLCGFQDNPAPRKKTNVLTFFIIE